MSTSFEQMSTIDLTQELRRLNRRVAEINTLNRSPMGSSHDVIAAAERDEQLAKLQCQRLAMGEELLKRDRELQESNRVRLIQSAAEASEVAKQLLDRLPAFAERVQTRLSDIATEFAELQDLSVKLFNLNHSLLNANIPSPVSASLHIVPAGLNSLLKRELTRVFGDGVSRSHVDPARMIKATIVESVVQIQEQVKIRSDNDDQ